jgi:hypothetical protein
VIEATALGLKQVDAVRAARRALYGTVLAGWADEDRSALAAYLMRLNDALDAHIRRQ